LSVDGNSATSAKQPSREKVQRRKHYGNQEKGNEKGSKEKETLNQPSGAQASLNFLRYNTGLRDFVLGGLFSARQFGVLNIVVVRGVGSC
jgi:hypothetical protein